MSPQHGLEDLLEIVSLEMTTKSVGAVTQLRSWRQRVPGFDPANNRCCTFFTASSTLCLQKHEMQHYLFDHNHVTNFRVSFKCLSVHFNVLFDATAVLMQCTLIFQQTDGDFRLFGLLLTACLHTVPAPSCMLTVHWRHASIRINSSSSSSSSSSNGSGKDADFWLRGCSTMPLLRPPSSKNLHDAAVVTFCLSLTQPQCQHYVIFV